MACVLPQVTLHSLLRVEMMALSAHGRSLWALKIPLDSCLLKPKLQTSRHMVPYKALPSLLPTFSQGGVMDLLGATAELTPLPLLG